MLLLLLFPDVVIVTVLGYCHCHCLQVPMQDLQEASSALIKALMIREKYMAMALQNFPRTTARFLATVDNKESYSTIAEGAHEERKTIEGTGSLSLSFTDNKD